MVLFLIVVKLMKMELNHEMNLLIYALMYIQINLLLILGRLVL